MSNVKDRLISLSSSDNMPKISVIIPNYNKADYILDTLESLRQQTFQNWEAIIIDDCSDDASVALVSQVAEVDSRFRLLVNEISEGGASARNRGLYSARGEYVLFLDSDDLLVETCLSTRIAILDENLSCDFVVSPMGVFEFDLTDSHREWRAKEGQNHLFQFLRHELPWSVMQPTWRLSFLLRINGFDPKYLRLQDVELHTRALMEPDVSYKVIADIKPDCFYRVSEQRIVCDKSTFMQRRVSGVCMYLQKIAKLIRGSDINVSKRLKALRGTYVSMLSVVCSQAGISTSLKQELLNQLSLVEKEIELFNQFNRYILNIYKCGLLFKAYKIKGYNFCFRWWFKVVCL